MYQAPVEGGLESLDITAFSAGTFSTLLPCFSLPTPACSVWPVLRHRWSNRVCCAWAGQMSSHTPGTAAVRQGGREQRGAQASVQGKDGGAEPFADQGIGDALRADKFLAVIQEQAISAIVIAALPHQSPGGSVLLVGHVGDFGCCHFTHSPGKILKASDFRF